jgi:hypothetical protein
MQLTTLQAQQVLVLWLLLTTSTTDMTTLPDATKTAIKNAVANVPGAGALFAKYIDPANGSMADDRNEAKTLLNTFLNSNNAGWTGPQCPRSVDVIMNMFKNLPG